jgi:8-oxo-dGTP diphosphatase
MAEITTAGIFRENNLLFAAKRLPGGSMGGRWEFPGGKAEAGESPREALRREIREEFGAEASVGRHIMTTRFSNEGKDYRLMVFEAAFKTPISELKAHEEIRWLPPEEIAALDLADSDRHVYEKLTQG